MINIEELNNTLCKMVKLNNGKRDLDINIREIAGELGCSSNDVLSGLKQLEFVREIKRLIPIGLSKNEYTVTVLEKSSILSDLIACGF